MTDYLWAKSTSTSDGAQMNRQNRVCGIFGKQDSPTEVPNAPLSVPKYEPIFGDLLHQAEKKSFFCIKKIGHEILEP